MRELSWEKVIFIQNLHTSENENVGCIYSNLELVSFFGQATLKSHPLSLSLYSGPYCNLSKASPPPILQFVLISFSLLSLVTLVFLTAALLALPSVKWENISYQKMLGLKGVNMLCKIAVVARTVAVLVAWPAEIGHLTIVKDGHPRQWQRGALPPQKAQRVPHTSLTPNLIWPAPCVGVSEARFLFSYKTPAILD